MHDVNHKKSSDMTSARLITPTIATYIVPTIKENQMEIRIKVRKNIMIDVFVFFEKWIS